MMNGERGGRRGGGEASETQTFAEVDAVMLKLPLRRENEGRGPIIIKATDQSTMRENEDQMTARRAEPATGQGGAWRMWQG
jgi:hypothetical protein